MSNPPIFNIQTMKLEKYDENNNLNIFPLYYMSRAHIEWTPIKPLYSGSSSINNNNAGDLLNEFIIYKISNFNYYKFTINGPQSIEQNTILCPERFLMIGSIATDSTENSILCGAGIIKNVKINKYKFIYGVRGKYTLNNIINNNNIDFNNIVLGDPGLLLSLFFNIEKTKKYKYGLILHMCDIELLKNYFNDDILEKIKIIDIRTDDFELLSKNINECEIIISSSLHGIIFSHSFNIPAIWIELENSILTNKNSDNIKFYDYFSVFNNDFVYDISKRKNKGNINNWIDYKININNINNLISYVPSEKEIQDKITEIYHMIKEKVLNNDIINNLKFYHN
jgi:pyruvyltransferase